MLTTEQLEQRRKGITATDVAKIVGLSPYGCGEDVRLSKMGEGRPFVEHPRVKWGHLLEAPIRDDYAERHGVYVESAEEVGTLTHPTEPWAMATPDGIVRSVGEILVYDGPPKRAVEMPGAIGWGHEVKTHTSWLSHLYGDPGTDQVPPWELIQCAWNTWVASAFYGVQIERWDLTVFLDGLPTDYTIMRDAELEGELVQTCHEFWQVHVIGGEPVPPDGSESFGEILGNRFPKHKEGLIVEATAEQQILIRDLAEARTTRKEWEIEEERIAQQVKLAIGEAEAISWPDDDKTQKINWKRSADGQTTDWKGAMAELHDSAEDGGLENISADDLENLASAHTEPKPGSRRFTVPKNFTAK